MGLLKFLELGKGGIVVIPKVFFRPDID